MIKSILFLFIIFTSASMSKTLAFGIDPQQNTEQYPSYPISINNKSLIKTNNEEYNTVKDLAIKMGIFTN